jgi:hypothetical protein
LIAPTDEPLMTEGCQPISARYNNTPTWKAPRAPPPASTKPLWGSGDASGAIAVLELFMPCFVPPIDGIGERIDMIADPHMFHLVVEIEIVATQFLRD